MMSEIIGMSMEGLMRLMESSELSNQLEKLSQEERNIIYSQLEEWLREECDMPGLRIKSIRGCDAEIYGGIVPALPTGTTMFYCFKTGKVGQSYCKDSEEG